MGVSAVSKQLGLHASQLYGWLNKAGLHQDRGDVEKELAAGNARLKRKLAEQADKLDQVMQ